MKETKICCLCSDCVRDNRSNSANVSARFFDQLYPLFDGGRLARTEVKEAASAWSHGPLQAGARTVGPIGKKSNNLFLNCHLR